MYAHFLDCLKALQMEEPGFLLLILRNGALLHTENVADCVELKLLAELLPDALLHKLRLLRPPP